MQPHARDPCSALTALKLTGAGAMDYLGAPTIPPEWFGPGGLTELQVCPSS